jgi:hypothetical protein
MLVVRYFCFVGAALLALLFVADACLPKLAAADRTASAADLPLIRIQSDRKWPQRVVFDTSVAPVSPVQVARTEPPVAASAAPAGVADASANAHMREAFAQLKTSDPAQSEPFVAKLPEPKLHPKRKVARRRPSPPMVMVAQQPPFGLFNNTW